MCWINILSVIPYFGFIVLRHSLQALHRVAPIVITSSRRISVTVFFNWVFIYGNLGSPALGVPGAAWATCLRPVGDGTRYSPSHGEILGTTCPRPTRCALLHARRRSFASARLLASDDARVSAFGMIGCSWACSAPRSLRLIRCNNLAATTFMVPLGVGAAAAVRVGRRLGRTTPPRRVRRRR